MFSIGLKEHRGRKFNTSNQRDSGRLDHNCIYCRSFPDFRPRIRLCLRPDYNLNDLYPVG